MHGRDSHGWLASCLSVAKLPYRDAQDGISYTVSIAPQKAHLSESQLIEEAAKAFDLYFGRGVPVTVTVQLHRPAPVEATLFNSSAGFNIQYDSPTGFQYTRWQVVEPGEGWATYTFQIPDASFANRDGFDLEALRRLPVLDGGRVKPLDTWVRTALRVISNREQFDDADDWVWEAEWDAGGARCISPHNRHVEPVKCYDRLIADHCGETFGAKTLMISETPADAE